LSTDLQKAFGRRVRELRKARGHSQEAFADLCGVHRTYMGKIEIGAMNVSFQNLVKLAGGLKITLGELMTGIEKPVELAPLSKGKSQQTADPIAGQLEWREHAKGRSARLPTNGMSEDQINGVMQLLASEGYGAIRRRVQGQDSITLTGADAMRALDIRSRALAASSGRAGSGLGRPPSAGGARTSGMPQPMVWSAAARLPKSTGTNYAIGQKKGRSN
jgi:transcriptional regulator with XRE-family HTH domain